MKFLLAIFVVVGLVGAGINYLSLPVVGINQGGECVYIVESGVKRDCDRVPTKYIVERVAGWKS